MAINIGRRKFVAVLGGTAFVRPFAARAIPMCRRLRFLGANTNVK